MFLTEFIISFACYEIYLYVHMKNVYLVFYNDLFPLIRIGKDQSRS